VIVNSVKAKYITKIQLENYNGKGLSGHFKGLIRTYIHKKAIHQRRMAYVLRVCFMVFPRSHPVQGWRRPGFFLFRYQAQIMHHP
jgi:hypothetical protein